MGRGESLRSILCEFVDELVFRDSFVAWGPDDVKGKVVSGVVDLSTFFTFQCFDSVM
jgi:hypothetical protein